MRRKSLCRSTVTKSFKASDSRPATVRRQTALRQSAAGSSPATVRRQTALRQSAAGSSPATVRRQTALRQSAADNSPAVVRRQTALRQSAANNSIAAGRKQTALRAERGGQQPRAVLCLFKLLLNDGRPMPFCEQPPKKAPPYRLKQKSGRKAYGFPSAFYTL